MTKRPLLSLVCRIQVNTTKNKPPRTGRVRPVKFAIEDLPVSWSPIVSDAAATIQLGDD